MPFNHGRVRATSRLKKGKGWKGGGNVSAPARNELQCCHVVESVQLQSSVKGEGCEGAELRGPSRRKCRLTKVHCQTDEQTLDLDLDRIIDQLLCRNNTQYEVRFGGGRFLIILVHNIQGASKLCGAGDHKQH